MDWNVSASIIWANQIIIRAIMLSEDYFIKNNSKTGGRQFVRFAALLLKKQKL